MFKEKYKVSILDSKWKVLKSNVNFPIIPRKDEYIFMDEQYYEVLNIVHRTGKIQEIFVIVIEFKNNLLLESTDNQLLVK